MNPTPPVPAPSPASRRPGRALAACLLLCAGVSASAQTIDDAVMMPARSLCTGVLFGHDSWDEYWEGTLKRDNENIGRLSTRSVTWVGNYGLTERLNVIAMLPYVWTRASQGTMAGMSGVQDLTLAAKYKLLETPLTSAGTLRAFAVASTGQPLSDYQPDFLPLSIGSHSRRYAGRLTLNFQTRSGFFVGATGAYTWRDKVTLDRAAYFTDGRLYMSNEVALPDVFDYTVSAGWSKGGWHLPVSFTQQSTLGGGDIRRQNMPFVADRMNFSKVEALAMVTLPRTRNLSFKLAGTYTVDGRNVGQSAAVTTGLLYTFSF